MMNAINAGSKVLMACLALYVLSYFVFGVYDVDYTSAQRASMDMLVIMTD